MATYNPLLLAKTCSVIFSLLDKSQDEPENEDKPTELAVKEDEKSMNILYAIF